MTQQAPRSRRLTAMAVVPMVVGGLGLVAASPSWAGTTTSGSVAPSDTDILNYRSLDGSGNNLNDPGLGQSGAIYTRETEAAYADGIGEPLDGPSERYVSNRIFNDGNQNVFSQNGVTHWGFVWGQFIDHTIGLREISEDEAVIAFDPDDPLESFANDLGAMTTTRSAAAEGSGVDSTREQVNTVSSYLDGWAVYGGSPERLDWLRSGPVDGDPTNNDATLLNADGYLPTASERPDVTAPTTDLMGRLFADPSAAVIAGDVRVNENLGLTAVQTLFMREHNRIVESLPDDMDDEVKFQLARRVVSALQQYITYEEFLPAMGVDLDRYRGYDSSVDPTVTNEFATVGYRAHSQVHGEFEAEIPVGQLDEEELATLAAQGVEVEVTDDVVEVAIPLNLAFGNPDLLRQIGLGNTLAGLASEAAYANDEQIDNQLRSVLFQIPGPETENPLECLDGESIADCYSGVTDLGSLDIYRSYDHGMPSYNDLRQSYGLAPATSFADLTGEASEEFPDDPEIDAANPIDDPNILDFVFLADGDGVELVAGTVEADTETVTAIRRTTTAARLKAVFGSVDEVDAFTGMVSEPHLEGTEFGELQLAMWERQFTALRDGDRFFYGNDNTLAELAAAYGVDYRRTLAEVIADNTEVEVADLPGDVFLLEANDESSPPVPTPDDDGGRGGRGGPDGERRPSDRPRLPVGNRPQVELTLDGSAPDS